jgi:single-stranded-DNA-specific exonuclease
MHESVAGIVAGRVRDDFNRPCVVLTQGEGVMKGSGRSIASYDLFAALYAHRHLFVRFGGHTMAAGLAMPEENINALIKGLNESCTLTESDFVETVYIEQALQPDEITLELSEELSRLAPFGKGNPEPLFVTYNLQIENVRRIDEKNTLIFTFLTKNKQTLKGIAFGMNERYTGCAHSIDVVYTVETNLYNGYKTVQIRIRDFHKQEG